MYRRYRGKLQRVASRSFTFADGLPGIEPEQQFSGLRMEDWLTHTASIELT